jgi:hypothetical protein
MKENEKNKNEYKATAFYLPEGLYQLTEVARLRLGLNRSKFIQFCIMRTLQDLSLLSEKVHAKEGGADG